VLTRPARVNDRQLPFVQFVTFERVRWARAADKLLDHYLSSTACDCSFLAEQFVQWAKTRIESPNDPRNWGGVISRAAHSKKIVRVGYAPAESSNGSPKCLWRARA
jgi:hypothetical protein